MPDDHNGEDSKTALEEHLRLTREAICDKTFAGGDEQTSKSDGKDRTKDRGKTYRRGDFRSVASKNLEANKRIISTLNDKLAERELDNFQLKVKITKLSSEPQRALTSSHLGCQAAPAVSSVESQTDEIDLEHAFIAAGTKEIALRRHEASEKDDSLVLLYEDGPNEEEPVSDEEYLGRLSEAEGIGEPEKELEKETDEDEQVRRKQEECRMLLDEIDDLDQIIHVYSYRYSCTSTLCFL
ncbi:unnamed protein product [Cylicocyclus nassatus]|uniref:Uncharacterized protein n=1 Tax=Cylicocyclus nassatus TaxID=53992 RepID=A0AA36H2P0_CYLNA|nr:unnamed protein product [Cylicocyclus nassatus]